MIIKGGDFGMYAIIAAGGTQFKVEPGMQLEMNRIAGEAGETVVLNDSVLLLQDDNGLQTGAPALADTPVELEILEHCRGKKLIVFKMKRRKSYRRKKGHRQDLTRVMVKSIGNSSVAEPSTAEAAPSAE